MTGGQTIDRGGAGGVLATGEGRIKPGKVPVYDDAAFIFLVLLWKGEAVGDPSTTASRSMLLRLLLFFFLDLNVLQRVDMKPVAKFRELFGFDITDDVDEHGAFLRFNGGNGQPLDGAF